MAENQFLTGGLPVDSLILVNCDQQTILGDGSIDHPLHTGNSQIGTAGLSLPPQCGIPTLQAGGLDTNVSIAAQNVQLSAAGSLYLGVPVGGGAKIGSFSVNLFGNGVTDVNVSLTKFSADQATATLLKSVTISNSPASWVTTLIPLDATAELAVGESFVIVLSPNAGGLGIGATVVYPPT